MNRPDEDPLEMRATPRVGADYPVQLYSSFPYEKSDIPELALEEAMRLAQVTRFRDIRAGPWLYRQGTSNPGQTALFLLTRGTVILQVRVQDASCYT